MLPPQDEMCNMYMMTYSELPVFMTCGNGQSWYQVDGPGGIPPGSSMAPESPAVWQPPPPVAAGAGDALALGQIAGALVAEMLRVACAQPDFAKVRRGLGTPRRLEPEGLTPALTLVRVTMT